MDGFSTFHEDPHDLVFSNVLTIVWINVGNRHFCLLSAESHECFTGRVVKL